MRHQANSSIVGASRRGLLALSVAASLLSATPAAPAPIHYDIDFTITSGSPPPLPMVGGFDYDSAIPEFTNFVVMWNLHFYHLTAAANSPIEGGGLAFSGACGVTGPALGFALITLAPCVLSDLAVVRWSATEPLDVFLPSRFEFVFATPFGPGQTVAFITQDEFFFPRFFPVPLENRGGWEVTQSAVGSVPEPPTAGLITLCLAVLAGLARRRQRSHTDAARRPI